MTMMMMMMIKKNCRHSPEFESETSLLIVTGTGTDVPTQPPNLLVKNGRFELYMAAGTATNKR